ncbi:MAG: hypothetical protein KatS3mg015_2786 [Fimbriimonadales bacterium]|nr:MAG: hypothetical protein KatS3mg015_2786 [Fimbriimonadales bacterium]
MNSVQNLNEVTTLLDFVHALLCVKEHPTHCTYYEERSIVADERLEAPEHKKWRERLAAANLLPPPPGLSLDHLRAVGLLYRSPWLRELLIFLVTEQVAS